MGDIEKIHKHFITETLTNEQWERLRDLRDLAFFQRFYKGNKFKCTVLAVIAFLDSHLLLEEDRKTIVKRLEECQKKLKKKVH